MIKINGFWVDAHNNKWSSDLFLKIDAEKYSKTLIDCEECIDCCYCENCNRCTYCIDCKNCRSCLACKDCLKCSECKNCFSCDDCGWCKICVCCNKCMTCCWCIDYNNHHFHTHNRLAEKISILKILKIMWKDYRYEKLIRQTIRDKFTNK